MAVRGRADHPCEALEDYEVKKVSKFKSIRVQGWVRTVLNGKPGSLYREGDGRVEILRLAVEHIGIKTPGLTALNAAKKTSLGISEAGPPPVNFPVWSTEIFTGWNVFDRAVLGETELSGETDLAAVAYIKTGQAKTD
jgi:hypothetical protein